MLAGTLELRVNETRSAVRINGVTVSKKHLGKCFPKTKSCEEAIFKYLTMVPFLSEKYDQLKDKFKDHTLYCATKAKRIHKTLNLNDENTLAFMALCMEKSGDLTPDQAEKLTEVTGTTFIHANAENIEEELAKIEDPEDRAMAEKIIKAVNSELAKANDLSPNRTLH